ncbi:hypothetical protein ACWDKQ_29460 [Saccharopolyspora sp. NPDC000995]
MFFVLLMLPVFVFLLGWRWRYFAHRALGYGEFLAAEFPAATMDPAPLYIRDGNVCT